MPARQAAHCDDVSASEQQKQEATPSERISNPISPKDETQEVAVHAQGPSMALTVNPTRKSAWRKRHGRNDMVETTW